MNERFRFHIDKMPGLYKALMESDVKPVSATDHSQAGGIYLLMSDRVEHVGRTRNLRQRLRSHRTLNHNSASFAFKKARRELGVVASYTKTGSRAALQLDEVFRECFRRHVAAVSEMTVRFLPVDEPINQYLLELYTVLELGMPADEFDTH